LCLMDPVHSHKSDGKIWKIGKSELCSFQSMSSAGSQNNLHVRATALRLLRSLRTMTKVCSRISGISRHGCIAKSYGDAGSNAKIYI
jgi:hypothetical protein